MDETNDLVNMSSFMNFSINTSTTALIEEMEKIQNYVTTPVKTYTDLCGATALSQESIVSEEYIFKKAAEISPEKNSSDESTENLLLIGRQLQKQPNKRSRKQLELEEKKINNLIIKSKKQEFREIKRDLKMQEMNKRKEIKEQKKTSNYRTN